MTVHPNVMGDEVKVLPRSTFPVSTQRRGPRSDHRIGRGYTRYFNCSVGKI